MSDKPGLARIVADTWAVLTFRASREQLLAMGPRHLGLGVLTAWIAGMGRYWDHPDAELLQYLGVGSVVYVFALGTLLYLLSWPLRPQGWQWTRVVTFVALTSPPAILYAIPVERFFEMSTAAAMNGWFLAVVATWRVALLVWFFLRLGQLGWARTIIAALLPLALIVLSLAILNLEHVVFDIMSGIQESSPYDVAYSIVFGLAMLSYVAAPVLLLAYIVAVAVVWIRVWRQQVPDDPGRGAAGG